MRAVARLAAAVDDGGSDELLLSPDAEPGLSANLCDGLVDMQPRGDDGGLELAIDWARTLPQPDAALAVHAHEVGAQRVVVGEHDAPGDLRVAARELTSQRGLDVAERELDVVVAREHDDAVASAREASERVEGRPVRAGDALDLAERVPPRSVSQRLDLQEVDEGAVDHELRDAAAGGAFGCDVVEKKLEVVIVDEVLQGAAVAEVEVADDRVERGDRRLHVGSSEDTPGAGRGRVRLFIRGGRRCGRLHACRLPGGPEPRSFFREPPPGAVAPGV
jgi:hypothetical protein